MEPSVQMSGVVFAGGPFPSAMFNERDLFGGNPDTDAQLRVGPAALFRYDSGAYSFELVPDRIDLKAMGQELFPESLLETADTIAKQLESVGSAAPVSAVGFNCDAVLPRSTIGVNGTSFCAGLADEALQKLADNPLAHTYARMVFESGNFTYEIRIEPYHQSQGEDLFAAVNATRRVASPSLGNLREDVREFAQYVLAFRERLAALGARRS